MASTASGRWAGRREEVLDALVRLFLAEGFRDSSVEDWAVRVGCSKTTLYRLAPSKDELVLVVVRTFFRASTDAVEDAVRTHEHPRERLTAYLLAIADRLAPASPAFYADVESFAPAREIYAQNSHAAAVRVQELVDQLAGQSVALDTRFVGVAVAEVMGAIQAGRVSAATGLDDSAAYRELATLVVAAVSPGNDSGPDGQ